MKGNYTYPAVVTIHESCAEIKFPDFNITTCSEDLNPENIIMSAQELLAITISDAIDCGTDLPVPSSVSQIHNDGNIVYINVWLPFFRAKEKIVYTKKTLTIPVWLDLLAKERNLNFSALLVEALKHELNLK